MSPQTFIFMGRSGCGKGTQAKLLMDYIAKEDSQHPIFSFTTGDHFRELFKRDTYGALHANEITKAGGLQPMFLSTMLWANSFMDGLTPEHHLFVDGSPRPKDEAKAFAGALEFFGRKEVHILDFIVAPETSAERMRLRERSDDTEENITRRLSWYEDNVAKSIEYLKGISGYQYHVLDGEKDIETIHQEVLNVLGYST